MRYMFFAVLVFISNAIHSQTTNYDRAWKFLNENNRAEAEKLLKLAAGEPASFEDAYISNIYLQSYNAKEDELTDFSKSFYAKAQNPYPYIFALWTTSPVGGAPGKRYFDHQLKLIDQLTTDEKAPGTIVASANYQRGLHSIFSNELAKSARYSAAMGTIGSWQYVGPFENLSESGFFKNYGPLEHPEKDAVFKSITNADVKWVTPPAEVKEGWIPVSYQFGNNTAVVYAQNFVTSSVDQSVYCNVGVSGSIKMWINDELVIAESKERVTDVDAYTVEYDLKKGVNRVLIQLCFSNNTYPNFALRFTDKQFRPLPGITGSPLYSAYPKATASVKKYPLLPHFAEAFFQDKIMRQPNNLVNYLLLCDTYLRSRKLTEARNLLSEAIEKAPDNCILKIKMVEVLGMEDNRTLMLEEIEKIKQADPESVTVLDMNIKEHFDNEKYEDGAIELEKRIKLHGEDIKTMAYKILLLANDKKYEDLVKEAERFVAKYPDNPRFIELMYAIKKDVYKDNKGAMKVYENFMKNNYNYTVFEKYASLLVEQGNNDKGLAVKRKLAEDFPYSPEGFHKMSQYHFSAKEYDKAEEYISKSIALSPYNEVYWEHLGDIKNEKKKPAEALEAYSRSLRYDPNQYSLINKIRKLDGKTELYKLFPEVDINKVIREDNTADAKNTDYGYYYVLDQKDVILYPGGATEEYYTMLIKITNEKGVDRYKESSIGYNSNQSLLIEKAEIIKKNQARIEGERSGDEIVFTNLEIGDVVVFKYRLQSFVYGRFAKEYWDKYYFGGQIYTAVTKYTILVPTDQKIKYQFNQSPLDPVIKDVENFKQYTWQLVKSEPAEDEPLMPVLADMSPVLHISTIPEWKEIATWYSDICNNKAEEDFEIVALYKKLFADTKQSMTQFQKAKRIYEYIESNIRYSSVSFRQSAYVPQRPSATLSTRLGDCKDLSSLFVTLAHMAGIDAQMVLVDTRDNGEQDIMLPGVIICHSQVCRAILMEPSYWRFLHAIWPGHHRSNC
jgi:predicted Zn-dependent protease